jgi:hypothetical protein
LTGQGNSFSSLTVVGIDVGLSHLTPSSGVCRTGASGFALAHTFADKSSRMDVLGGPCAIDILAIDGPLPPGLRVHSSPRLCEMAFVLGRFQKRCKPGESHIRGTGTALTRAATDTAGQFLDSVSGRDLSSEPPRIVDGKNLVEAFPNAFLGVLLPDEEYATILAKRGDKMAVLLDRARRCGALQQLEGALGWDDDAFWNEVGRNTQHDESAALVCALTGVGVVQGAYTAVGDEEGGFFFLPPWDLWQPWAREQLQANLGRLGRSSDVPGPHVRLNGNLKGGSGPATSP